MSLLINDTDFKATVKVAKAFSFDNIKPQLRQVQRKVIKPVLGTDFLAELLTAYAGSPTDAQQELLDHIHAVMANLAMWLYADGANIIWTDSGAQIKHAGDMKSAFQWQVRDAKKQHMNTGFEAVDELIEFLEENKADYASWNSFTESRSLIINTSKDFSQYVRVSRRVFEDIKPAISRIERDILTDLLGTTLYAAIKAGILADNLSTENKKLLPDLEAITAHLSYAQALIDLPVVIDEQGAHLYNDAFSGNYDGAEPADSDRVNRMINQQREYAHVANKRLINFIHTNIADYPDFKTSVHYVDPEAEVVDDSDDVMFSL